jgi:hypothetical protein
MQKVRRIAISVFLLFHLVAITCWSIPLESPLLTAYRDLVRPYMLWSGLFQHWDMFAPEPLNVNAYVEGRVTFDDAHTVTWTFPRMENLSLLDRYFQERYRKFTLDNLMQDANSALWPDAARHLARMNNKGGSQPVVVILIRSWSEIQPPGKDGAFRAAPWKSAGFFIYLVQPKDLK